MGLCMVAKTWNSRGEIRYYNENTMIITWYGVEYGIFVIITLLKMHSYAQCDNRQK